MRLDERQLDDDAAEAFLDADIALEQPVDDPLQWLTGSAVSPAPVDDEPW